MKLLVDVGNTRVKLAVLEKNALRFVAAVPTQDAALMRQALEEQIAKLGAIEGVCASGIWRWRSVLRRRCQPTSLCSGFNPHPRLGAFLIVTLSPSSLALTGGSESLD